MKKQLVFEKLTKHIKILKITYSIEKLLRVCLTMILRSVFSLKNVFFFFKEKVFDKKTLVIVEENEDGCGWWLFSPYLIQRVGKSGLEPDPFVLSALL